MKRGLAFVLGLLLLGWSGAALADPEATTPEQVTQGAGSVLATLVYSPVKASFCILGGVASAFTALASPPTAGKVVGASCGGTWMITPDVLKGREQVKFVGDGHTVRSVATR